MLEIDYRRVKTVYELAGVDQITGPTQQVLDESFNPIVSLLKQVRRLSGARVQPNPAEPGWV